MILIKSKESTSKKLGACKYTLKVKGNVTRYTRTHSHTNVKQQTEYKRHQERAHTSKTRKIKEKQKHRETKRLTKLPVNTAGFPLGRGYSSNIDHRATIIEK